MSIVEGSMNIAEGEDQALYRGILFDSVMVVKTSLSDACWTPPPGAMPDLSQQEKAPEKRARMC